jgi:hypothetical protein
LRSIQFSVGGKLPLIVLVAGDARTKGSSGAVGRGDGAVCLRSWARCSEAGLDGGSRSRCGEWVEVAGQGWAERGRPGWAVREKRKEEEGNFWNLGCNFWNFKSKTFSNSNKDLNLLWKQKTWN